MADTKTYRFTGMKDDWNTTDRIILKGSTDNPEEYITKGGIGDLTQEQYEDLKAHGHKLTALSPEDAKKAKDEQLASVTEAATRRGADQMDPEAVLAAQRAQKEGGVPDTSGDDDEQQRQQQGSQQRAGGGASGSSSGGQTPGKS